jgi:hypothetical protein
MDLMHLKPDLDAHFSPFGLLRYLLSVKEYSGQV